MLQNTANIFVVSAGPWKVLKIRIDINTTHIHQAYHNITQFDKFRPFKW